MRLLFKQRFLSWFDSYDIYDEEGAPPIPWRASCPGDTG